MKVNENCFLLKGKLRSALYDLNNGSVAPISDIQERIICTIANGHRVNSITDIDAELIRKELSDLISSNVIIAGRRKYSNLNLPKYDNPTKPSTLKHVWLELTNSCNLTCSHCYAGSSPKIKISNDFGLQNWITILNKLLVIGVKKFTFIGGEPMIHFDLMNELINYIHEFDKSIDLVIYSNLTLVPDDDKWFSFLHDHKVSFGTSIYGINPETHDDITMKKGSWNITVKSIRTLRNNGFRVYVGYYYNENKKVDKEEIRNFIQTLGVSNFKIIAPAKIGRGETLAWQNNITFNSLPKTKYFDVDTFSENFFYHNCYKDVLTVKSDGTVLPCIMTRDNPLINLLVGDFETLNSSQEYQKFVSMSKDKIEGCCECEFRYGCFDCRPEAFTGDKNLYSKSHCGYDPRMELYAPLM